MSAGSYLDHCSSYNKKTKRWDQRQHPTRDTVLVSLRLAVTPGGREPCLFGSPYDHSTQQIFSDQLTGLPPQTGKTSVCLYRGKAMDWLFGHLQTKASMCSGGSIW